MRGAISKEIDVVAGLHAKHQTGRLAESRAFVVAFWDERGAQRVTNSNEPRPSPLFDAVRAEKTPTLTATTRIFSA